MIELFEADKSVRLGYLTPDVISCLITEENTNDGIYELEMEYPSNARFYKEIQMRRLIRVKPNPFDDPEYFRIMSIDRGMDGICTINAVHISYDLNGIVVAPYQPNLYDNPGCLKTMNDFKKWVKEHHYGTTLDGQSDQNISVEYNPTINLYIPVPTTLRSLLAEVNSQTRLCEYEFKDTVCHVKKRRGEDGPVIIEYGKNMIDLTQSEDCLSMYSGCYPYWLGTDENTPEGQRIYKAAAKICNDGTNRHFDRVMPLDCSQYFDSPPTESDLISYGEIYFTLAQMGDPSITISVSYLDLSTCLNQGEVKAFYKLRLGDTVKVRFPALKIDVSARCVKTIYDAKNGRYDSIEIGNVTRSSLDKTLFEGKG